MGRTPFGSSGRDGFDTCLLPPKAGRPSTARLPLQRVIARQLPPECRVLPVLERPIRRPAWQGTQLREIMLEGHASDEMLFFFFFFFWVAKSPLSNWRAMTRLERAPPPTDPARYGETPGKPASTSERAAARCSSDIAIHSTRLMCPPPQQLRNTKHHVPATVKTRRNYSHSPKSSPQAACSSHHKPTRFDPPHLVDDPRRHPAR